MKIARCPILSLGVWRPSIGVEVVHHEYLTIVENSVQNTVLTACQGAFYNSLRKGTYSIPLCRLVGDIQWRLSARKSGSTTGRRMEDTLFFAPMPLPAAACLRSREKVLHRLARRGRVLKVKDYFYVIVPLEYQSAGGPPAAWFIHDLMAAMRLPYYVGLLRRPPNMGPLINNPRSFRLSLTDRSAH